MVFGVILAQFPAWAQSVPAGWEREWSRTDFSKSTIDFSGVISGGPPKDGIPAIDDPQFVPVSQVEDIGAQEPVITLSINGEAKAYPLRIMMWHEIANDEIGGIPVTVTYCPLCNSAVVFDRRVNDKVLDFGVSGKLRHSDMIMYDRQTESWWQQFVGRSIVGEMTGVELKRLPARVIPFSSFKSSFPDGKVLMVSNHNARRYGENPYVKYDSAENPFLYRGRYDGPGQPLSYVVAVGKEAWLLEDLRKASVIEHGDLRLRWQEGMNSALDSSSIEQGRDIGFVTVQKKTASSYEDIPYDRTFAFAFKAFHRDGIIYEK
ncbi:MAG: DUF3179 domain-containing protein [Alphaproteobacteria bacterium]|nr:DUF3179 domain-containing protein [Alphaproteobacteria bacterium]